jgi:hypothetical protein
MMAQPEFADILDRMTKDFPQMAPYTTRGGGSGAAPVGAGGVAGNPLFAGTSFASETAPGTAGRFVGAPGVGAGTPVVRNDLPAGVRLVADYDKDMASTTDDDDDDDEDEDEDGESEGSGDTVPYDTTARVQVSGAG